jgi:hypothetical protein
MGHGTTRWGRPPPAVLRGLEIEEYSVEVICIGGRRSASSWGWDALDDARSGARRPPTHAAMAAARLPYTGHDLVDAKAKPDDPRSAAQGTSIATIDPNKPNSAPSSYVRSSDPLSLVCFWPYARWNYVRGFVRALGSAAAATAAWCVCRYSHVL